MKKKNDKNETVDEKSDDTEIGKLISEIVERGEPELAEAIEAVFDGLTDAKRLTAIAFSPEAANNHAFVLEIYDRVLEQIIVDDDDGDDDIDNDGN